MVRTFEFPKLCFKSSLVMVVKDIKGELNFGGSILHVPFTRLLIDSKWNPPHELGFVLRAMILLK